MISDQSIDSKTVIGYEKNVNYSGKLITLFHVIPLNGHTKIAQISKFITLMTDQLINFKRKM